MPKSVTVFPSPPSQAELTLPGDKSISHRAFLLNVLGSGEASIRGCNAGADVANTRAALRALGVRIHSLGENSYRLRGRAGRLRPANDALDCGNSGTSMRLLAGLLAAQPFTSSLDGDASLRRRPMQRIAEPLRQLGARVEGPNNAATAPLIVSGGALRPPAQPLVVGSAQVKSCLLLAAVAAACPLDLREEPPTRDHTERLLRCMGASLVVDGGTLRYAPKPDLQCVDVDVPGDASAAALLAAVLLLIPRSEIAFRNLLLNPTRIGFVSVLERMGIERQQRVERTSGGEESGWLHLRAPAAFRAVEVGAAEVPHLIDEVPALAVLAAFAPAGESRFDGLAELRVKESDRIAAICELLEQANVATRIEADRLCIGGGQAVQAQVLRPVDDHRIVMAAVALACGIAVRRQHAVQVEGVDSAAISDPSFLASLSQCGVRLAA